MYNEKVHILDHPGAKPLQAFPLPSKEGVVYLSAPGVHSADNQPPLHMGQGPGHGLQGGAGGAGLSRRPGQPELFDIGWEDYLTRGGVCSVEWSENVADALEDGAILVRSQKIFRFFSIIAQIGFAFPAKCDKIYGG